MLTMPVDHDGVPVGFVQGGFDLTLHDQQSRSLVLAVLVVGALGLVAAAAIAYVVTGPRARPDPRGLRGPAAVRRRRVARAADARRAHPCQRRGPRARGRSSRTTGATCSTTSSREADRLGGLVGDLLQLAAWDETSLTIAPVRARRRRRSRATPSAARRRSPPSGVGPRGRRAGSGAGVGRPGPPRPAPADPGRQRHRPLARRRRGQPSRVRRTRPRRDRRGRPGARASREPSGSGSSSRSRASPGTTRHGSGRHGPRPCDRAPDRRGARRVDPAERRPAGGARFTVSLPAGAADGRTHNPRHTLTTRPRADAETPSPSRPRRRTSGRPIARADQRWSRPMAYVIAAPCVDHTDQSCVAVCPVDCICGDLSVDRKLYVDPDACIECGSCETACPNGAILPEKKLEARVARTSPGSTRPGSRTRTPPATSWTSWRRPGVDMESITRRPPAARAADGPRGRSRRAQRHDRRARGRVRQRRPAPDPPGRRRARLRARAVPRPRRRGRRPSAPAALLHRVGPRRDGRPGVPRPARATAAP